MVGATLPDGRVGRILALGITLAVLLIGWVGIASPLLGWYAQGADRLELRRTVERRMAGIAADLPRLRQSEATGGGRGTAPMAVLDGATDAVAAATLQQRVQEMATQSGATLTSTETLPATQVAAYRRIGLHLSLSAPWPVLARLIQRIEQASPGMLVDDLQLHGPRMVAPPPEPPLEAGLTVFAFRAGSAPVGTVPR